MYSNSRLHLQTLQTIAFSAYLRESGHSKPFLSRLSAECPNNWIENRRSLPKGSSIIQLPLDSSVVSFEAQMLVMIRHLQIFMPLARLLTYALLFFYAFVTARYRMHVSWAHTAEAQS